MTEPAILVSVSHGQAKPYDLVVTSSSLHALGLHVAGMAIAD